MNLNENIFRVRELMGILKEEKRKRFDFEKLYRNGILWVTEPYSNGKKDMPNWEHDSNIVTLWNLQNPEQGQEWVFDAIEHPKTESLSWWTQKGQDDLSDEKYQQILKSIKLKNKKSITESSEEEAWELVGQDNKIIKSIVSKKGYKNNESSVKKLVKIFDNLPVEEFEYEQLKKFHNIENKENDAGLLKKMKIISKKDNPRDEYEKYMKTRDRGEKRKRGYDPVKNFDRIVSDSYESPVVLKVGRKFYLIGGRTRIYASIAAGKPIKIKILTPTDL